MAEILPAVIDRRWAHEPPVKSRRKLSRASRLLALTLALLFISGMTFGLVAWWRPLSQPVWIILTVAREDTASIPRRLAVAGDGIALADSTKHDRNSISRRDGITRRECEQLLAALHLVRENDRLCVYLGAAAGLNHRGEVVLFPSDIGPRESDSAILLVDLLTAIDRCESRHRLLLLDLSPVDGEEPDLAPPVGLGAAIERVLRKHAASGFLVITSSSGEEATHELPGHCRSLFGWLVQRGLAGAADGVGESAPDGRVASHELVAYLQAQLPLLAKRTCGAPQTPGRFGEVSEFEISVVSQPIPSDEPTTQLGEYPKWLTSSWADFRTARDSGIYAKYLESFHRLTEALLTAELAWERLAPPELLAEFQTELVTAQQAFQNLAGPAAAPSTADATAAAALATLTDDIASYLAAVQQQTVASLADQQASPAAKLQADFLKAHAKTPVEQLAEAIFNVAQQPQSTTPTNLQTLVSLLDALPKSPTDDNSQLLRAVAMVAQTTASETWQPAAAQRTLRIAAAMHTLTYDATDWPWISTMLDQAWNDRVSGEVLLLAQGYAPYSEALGSLQTADEECQLLQQCAATLGTARSTRDEALVCLPNQVSRAAAEPSMTTAWLAATAALRAIEASLSPPTTPPANIAALRLMFETLARERSNLRAQLDILQRPLQPAAIALRTSECNAPGAGAHELIHAERLLASPHLSIAERAALTKAYQNLSEHLLTQVLRNVSAASPLDAPTIAMLDRSANARQRMASVWVNLPAPSQSPSDSAASQASAMSWREAAFRYRNDQWQRILARNDPQAQRNDTPSWSISGISFLSPLVCDELTRLQNDAKLNIAWHLRSESSAPVDVNVNVISPGRELSISPRHETLTDRQPVALEMRWQPTAAASNKTSISGFLLVLTHSGRSYFAPIALPNLEDQSEVLLTLSSSPDKCTPLPDRVDLRPNGIPQPLYIFAQNNTPKPQQVTLQAGGLVLAPPFTLAPHELKAIALPSVPGNLTTDHHQLLLQAIDTSTQNRLGEHVYTIAVRRPSDAAEVLSAQIQSDPQRGVVVTVEIVALTSPEGAPVDVGLTIERPQPGAAVRAQGGQLQGVLNRERRSLTLSASGLNFSPGEPIRCGISIDDVTHVLVYEGQTPAFGASDVLIQSDAPTASLVGKSFSTPEAQYQLDVTAPNAPPHSQIEVVLLPTVAPLTPLLQRQLRGVAPLSIAWQATKPPGGLLVSASGSQELQTFDTSGLVGRYEWHATLRNQQGLTIATTQLPVVFDNSPPVAARFVSPPATAVKKTNVPLVATAWDELSNIASAQFFVGQPVDGKPPATAKLIAGQRKTDDVTLWTAELQLPSEAGPTDLSVLFTDGAGLTACTTTTIQVLEAAPVVVVGSIHGEVLEASRPQAGLEVILQHATGAEIARTKTGDDGTFTFPNLAPGDYQLQTTKASSQRSAHAKLKVLVGPPTPVTLKLVMESKKV